MLTSFLVHGFIGVLGAICVLCLHAAWSSVVQIRPGLTAVQGIQVAIRLLMNAGIALLVVVLAVYLLSKFTFALDGFSHLFKVISDNKALDNIAYGAELQLAAALLGLVFGFTLAPVFAEAFRLSNQVDGVVRLTAILAIPAGALVIAVMLPHFDQLFQSAKQLKIGGVEVLLEKESVKLITNQNRQFTDEALRRASVGNVFHNFKNRSWVEGIVQSDQEICQLSAGNEVLACERYKLGASLFQSLYELHLAPMMQAVDNSIKLGDDAELSRSLVRPTIRWLHSMLVLPSTFDEPEWFRAKDLPFENAKAMCETAHAQFDHKTYKGMDQNGRELPRRDDLARFSMSNCDWADLIRSAKWTNESIRDLREYDLPYYILAMLQEFTGDHVSSLRTLTLLKSKFKASLYGAWGLYMAWSVEGHVPWKAYQEIRDMVRISNRFLSRELQKELGQTQLPRCMAKLFQSDSRAADDQEENTVIHPTYARVFLGNDRTPNAYRLFKNLGVAYSNQAWAFSQYVLASDSGARESLDAPTVNAILEDARCGVEIFSVLIRNDSQGSAIIEIFKREAIANRSALLGILELNSERSEFDGFRAPKSLSCAYESTNAQIGHINSALRSSVDSCNSRGRVDGLSRCTSFQQNLSKLSYELETNERTRATLVKLFDQHGARPSCALSDLKHFELGTEDMFTDQFRGWKKPRF